MLLFALHPSQCEVGILNVIVIASKYGCDIVVPFAAEQNSFFYSVDTVMSVGPSQILSQIMSRHKRK